jgi:acetyl-CoA acetyltransferase
MLTAPIPATQNALERSGLSVDEIGVFEINEAVAVVPLAWLKDIGADEKNLNHKRGAIALGHPLGDSGARIMTTMLYHNVGQGNPLRTTDHVRGWWSGQRDHSGASVTGTETVTEARPEPRTLVERRGNVLGRHHQSARCPRCAGPGAGRP